MGNPRADWCFKTEPSRPQRPRAHYPRGKVIGGCSAINGMIYMRGQAADYDHWRQLGNPGWGWDDVLPYFIKSEHREGPADTRRTRQRRRMAGRAPALALEDPRRVPRTPPASTAIPPVDDLQHRRQ
jgi:choline dehydrogenase-like flavoprotein